MGFAMYARIGKGVAAVLVEARGAFVLVDQPATGDQWFREMREDEVAGEQTIAELFIEEMYQGDMVVDGKVVRGPSAVGAHYEFRLFLEPGRLWTSFGIYVKGV